MPSAFRLFHLILTLVVVTAAVAPARGQLSSQEQQIVTLLSNASGQGRDFVEVNAILSKVARAKAIDLARRDYFAHVDPDGKGANTLVREEGYPLPSHYDQAQSGNNIESLAAGYPTPQNAWSNWMTSPSHKMHLMAQNSFFAEQTSIGVGYHYDADSTYKHYWVVLTAPPMGPSLAITSPAVNAGLILPQATISGTSGGSPAAVRMTYRLENAAGTTEFRSLVGTRTWTGLVTGLTPGTNTVRVRSLDAAGGTLKELTRSFRFVVLQPLLVSTTGSGSVTAGYLGNSNRELGTHYTITAKAAPGWIFDRWSGSVNSTNAALSFTMQEGLSLTAHFRENPFYARKGSYNGLITGSPMTHASSGFLNVKTTAAGAFSGTLTLGGKAYALKGKFDAAGNAEVAIKQAATLPPLAVRLHLDLEGGTDRITGSLSDGTFTAAFASDQASTATTPHFAEGRYTLALLANAQNLGATYPQGDGSAFLNVTSAGVATLKGTLADGRTFSQTATISKTGVMPVYVALLSATGSIHGTLQFQSGSSSVTGSIVWTKGERPRDRYYPAAFVTRLDVVGSRYIAPVAGTTVLNVPAAEANTRLWLSDGDLPAAIPQPATLLTNNRI
ncbi:MAG TPA: CAP domain-containing protein, partial [Chthoniobacteraceae bacterium]|nr:CAP domain-containing protein [Chthoniobacteraceae bacterium]